MILPIFAIICLTLGITSGEVIDQMNDKSGLINDPTNDLIARRLLYVVGFYPEWAKKIADFKKKWGNEGEKYLDQSNIYIHGDYDEKMNNIEVTTRKIMDNTYNQVSLETTTKSEQTDKETRRLNEYNKKNSNLNDLPEIIQINITDTRRNDIARRRQEDYKNFMQDILKFQKINPRLIEMKDDAMLNNKNYGLEKLLEVNIPSNSDKPEKGDTTESNDLKGRRFNNVSKIYRNRWNEMPDNLSKGSTNNNEEYRKYSNIAKMYGRVMMRRYGNDDMTEIVDTLENKPTSTDERARNYWLKNQDNKDQIDDDDTDHNKKYTYIGKLLKKNNAGPVPRLKNEKIVRGMFMNTQPEVDLKWIKEVLIPRLLNGRKYVALGSDEINTNPNVGDDSSTESLKKTNPILNTEKNINENQLHYNTNTIAQEIRGRKKLISKLSDSQELIRKRLLKKKQFEKGILNTKLEGINEESNSSI